MSSQSYELHVDVLTQRLHITGGQVLVPYPSRRVRRTRVSESAGFFRYTTSVRHYDPLTSELSDFIFDR